VDTKEKENTMFKWGILWRSNNMRDGVVEELQWVDGNPCPFNTRDECRAHIKENFQYFRDRKDLMREPFGWRMPIPVKVVVSWETSKESAIDRLKELLQKWTGPVNENNYYILRKHEIFTLIDQAVVEAGKK